MIKAILFEDNYKFRKSLSDYLSDSGEVTLVDAFPNALEAINKIKEINPDIVLMDIQMPGKTGIEALIEIRRAKMHTKVLMLTGFDDDDKIFSSLRAGANGYALKATEDKAEGINLIQAIKDVTATERCGYMSPSIAYKVIQFFNDKKIIEKPDFKPLTPRQKEILDLLADGLSRKLIADKIAIKEHTVNDHIKAIYEKLDVNSALEAVKKWRLFQF
jgi:DNA-binding NarL/FixJ family response regulator